VAKRTKSALKRMRQTVKRTLRNRAVRSRIKTLLKRARTASSPQPEAIRAAVSALDSAARKGIIHPNTAARKKSRLMRWAARQQVAAPAS
jgi:small subunit ribosomal protein S20